MSNSTPARRALASPPSLLVRCYHLSLGPRSAFIKVHTAMPWQAGIDLRSVTCKLMPSYPHESLQPSAFHLIHAILQLLVCGSCTFQRQSNTFASFLANAGLNFELTESSAAYMLQAVCLFNRTAGHAPLQRVRIGSYSSASRVGGLCVRLGRPCGAIPAACSARKLR